MAIIHFVRGISVEILVDGFALHEYNGPIDKIEPGEVNAHIASHTVQKYVESIAGKKFGIHFIVGTNFKFDFETLGVEIKIDGIRVISQVLPRRGALSQVTADKVYSGVKETGPDDVVMMREFMFSEILTTDDDDKLSTLEQDKERFSEAGTIELWLHRRDTSSTVGRNNVKLLKTPKGMEKAPEVHEKVFKGESSKHGTILGRQKPSTPNQGGIVMNSKYLDPQNRPLAIFKFKYRSREALKVLGIAPEPKLEPQSLEAENVKVENIKVEPEFRRSKGPDGQIKCEYVAKVSGLGPLGQCVKNLSTDAKKESPKFFRIGPPGGDTQSSDDSNPRKRTANPRTSTKRGRNDTASFSGSDNGEFSSRKAKLIPYNPRTLTGNGNSGISGRRLKPSNMMSNQNVIDLTED